MCLIFLFILGRKETPIQDECKEKSIERGQEQEDAKLKEGSELDSEDKTVKKNLLSSSVHVTLQPPKLIAEDTPVSSELYIDCKVDHQNTDFSHLNSSLLQKVDDLNNSLAPNEDKSLPVSEVSAMTPDEAEKLLSTRFVISMNTSSTSY